jgi:1,4-dihydroxy-2-naphthoate octaprenyltransferase
MQCNIDRRGQRARLFMSLALLFAAGSVAALWLAGFMADWLFIIILLPLLASGLFVMYEARQRWCVARAMGFRTRI